MSDLLKIGDRVICDYPVKLNLPDSIGTVVALNTLAPTAMVDFGCGPVERAWFQLRKARINPDCATGKHPACRGDAWDHDEDIACSCECECHS